MIKYICGLISEKLVDSRSFIVDTIKLSDFIALCLPQVTILIARYYVLF